MKQTLTYTSPILTSTASKMDVDAWDRSMQAYDEKKYLDSFYALIDYINPEFRNKYGNKEQTEFNIPHGSIIVTIKIEKDHVKITAPFLKVGDKNRVTLLRQIASLNMNYMLISQIYLKGDELYFEYSCPLSLVEPYKMYYTMEDICYAGDKYDDEFVVKFGATRIHEPKITPYDAKDVDSIYENIQNSCKECFEWVEYFEKDRKYGFAWNVIDTTILKILYFAHPQGQLLNDFNKAVIDLDRDENTPLATIVTDAKEFLSKVQKMPKEKLAEELYYIETFIPPKRRSTLPNIQDNFKSTAERAGEYYAQGDFMTSSLMITNKFYQMYYYNNVQDDVNNLIAEALKTSGGKDWAQAAPILHNAMKKIMTGDISSASPGVFKKLFGGMFGK